jgi:hypothetical protein
MAAIRKAATTGDAAAMAAAQTKLVAAVGGQEKTDALGARITEAAQAEMPAVTKAMAERVRAGRASIRTIDSGELESMVERLQGQLTSNPNIAGELAKKRKR